jgi:hypothetical protein
MLWVLAFLVVAAPSAPGDDLDVLYDGAYRMTALDAALDGSSLWVATSWGIALHDLSGSAPRPVGARALQETTSSVEVGPTHVYVGSGRRIHVFARASVDAVLETVDAAGTINDLLVSGSYLYAATSMGVEQFDLLNPAKPAKNRSLLTSTGFALRLAVMGSTLYAADGDTSVEAYNLQLPSLPQGIGSFGVLARTQAVSEAGGRLYVSDGRRTDIWSGSGASLTRTGSIAAGGNSVVAVGTRFVYLAGDDRRLRGFDVASAAEPIKAFVSDAIPVGGTVNRLLRIVVQDTRLHVAAGDAGLLTWETAGFDAPFLTMAYATATGDSVAAYPGGLVAAGSGSGLVKYAIGAGGELSGRVEWDTDTASVVHDATSTTLLVASGARLRRFDLATSPPAQTGSVSLPTGVRSAVLRDGNAIAVLGDLTAWSVDFGAGSATKLEIGGAPLFVAAGDGDLAFADFNEDGTTTIRFYAGGDLAASPASATVEGAASSGIALSGRRVGCFTFRGITTVDFGSGAVASVVPGSNVGIAAGIDMSAATFFLLTSSGLQVWDAANGKLLRTAALEGVPMAVAHAPGQPTAVVTTSEGLVTVQFTSGTEPPANTARSGGSNRYFREALVGHRTLHLWDGRDLASAPIDSLGLPGPWRELRPAEAGIGVAAVDDRVYVVTPGGTVAGYSAAGQKVATFQIDESADQRILSIRSVAGALWVSVEVNCLSGGCEFRTLVLDPRAGIAKTSTLSGGAVAATVEGSTAWALFQVPDEVRSLDVSNPYLPAVTALTPSAGNPVAIARDPKRGATYVLGDRLYVYGAGLALAGQLFEPWENDPSGRVSYIDQRLHVLGDLAVVTGREFSPAVYTIGAPTAWFPTETPGAKAAAVRSSVKREGRLYLLSDYSLEIWSSLQDEPPRRRPVR